jgi:hypothetical protein
LSLPGNDSNPRPLHGLKIAITIPPPSWFGSVDFKFAHDMAADLRAMGADLIEVDTGRLVARDPLYVPEILADLRRFKPDVALATPNAGYGVLCADAEGRNLFRDHLEIPTLMIWDHGALQFSRLLLTPLPETPSGSSEGSIARMRDALDHPLFIHYSPDRGHTAVMRELGILVRQPVHQFVQPAFPVYTRPVTELSASAAPKIAFAGNVYLESAQRMKFRENPVLAAIESGMLAAKTARPQASLWELLMEEIGRLEDSVRRELRLFPDASFFWRFTTDEIIFAGTTHVRLNMLTSIRRRVDFFGNFVEPDSSAVLRERYGLRMGPVLDFGSGSGLPWLYRNAEIVVDAVHPCYISGTSPKINSCFAAGGLMLFDWREEYRQALGDIAERVMYRDADHLNARIDEYLGDPRRRREVAREMQDRILGGFTFAHLTRRMLVSEPAWRGARTAGA